MVVVIKDVSNMSKDSSWTTKSCLETWSAMELYDSQIEPDENLNIAGFLENEEIFAVLSGQLRGGWRFARLTI